MANAINQLIWLGAGSASQPANIITQANKVLLIEARAPACQQLSQQFRQHNAIAIQHMLISEQGGEVSFTEYNLAEYSALSTVTGLNELFPGLKPVKTQPQHSKTLLALLQPLALSGNNNGLVIDIADISLLLLQQLQSAELLAHFSQLWLQGSNSVLYNGAATQQALTEFLQQHGFSLHLQDNTDPDLPWLQFSLNPLWQQLQQSRQTHQHITAQKQQLVTDKQQIEQVNADLAKQLEAAKQQLTTETKQAEQHKAEFTKQLAAAKQQAEQASTELTKKSDAVKQQLLSEKQQAEQKNTELAKQLDTFKQQLVADKQQAEKNSNKVLQQAEEQKLESEQKLKQFQQQLANKVSENETLQQQLAVVKVSSDKALAELNGRITGMDAELEKTLQQLKKAEQHLSSANEQSIKQEQECTALKQQLEQANTDHKKQLAELKQQQEQVKHDALAQQQTLAKENSKLQAELEQVSKHAMNRLEKIAQLEKINRQLNETNEQLSKRQQALEQEMLKAHAQIDIIKDLLLKQ